MLDAVPWSVEQVLALAPDPAAARAGRDLSSSHKWQAFARNDAAVWGHCKGSAAEPYKTVIDLAEPAFKCTCPSRKFPCKHGLGLFLIYASNPGSIPAGDVPPWAAEWLAKRIEKSRTKPAENPKTQEDDARLAEQQQKRAQKRAARVEDGVDELRLWLQDLMREGFRELPSRPRQFWDQPAARMVDAQAPGLARRIQEMATIPYSGSGWPERLLIRVGRLHLLLEGHRRLDLLPEEMQQQVRAHLGFTQSSDDVIASGERLKDVWSVMGRRVTIEERLVTQRTWLYGKQTQQFALVLDFAPPRGANPHHGLDLSLVPGTTFEATVAFFPGSLRRRALVVERGSPDPISDLPGHGRIEGGLSALAESLARDPWVGLAPLHLQEVRPVRRAEDWFVADAEGFALPVLSNAGWKLLAISGGHPIDVFGEWDWERLDALSAIGSDGFAQLGQTAA
jgi:SWIM zinc finger